MKTKIISILFAFGLLCSCDHFYDVKYSVVNKTSSDLNLTLNQRSGYVLGASYDLKPNDEVTIFITSGPGKAEEELTKEEIDTIFLRCLILTKDSIPLKLDIRNKDSWTVEAFGDTLAKYRLIIKSDSTK